MPSTINKAALQTLVSQVLRERAKSPSYKAGTQVLDRLVAILGDKSLFGVTTLSSAKIAARLASESLTLEQKLALARAGLNRKEKADVKALLGDAKFVATLEPTVESFLKALVGLGPLRGIDAVEGGAAKAVTAAQPAAPTPEQVAVQKMRTLVTSGTIKRYYEAAIGAVDDPALKKEAMELFAQLPVISTRTSADEMVRLGFWKMAPRGYDAMQKSARYLPGRQLLVETKVNISDVDRTLKAKDGYWGGSAAQTDVLAYDPKGVDAVTYRATLAGEDPKNPNNFLVDVDSMGGQPPARVSVSKERIFELNQPHELDGQYVRGPDKQELPWAWSCWTMDYTSPWSKAKLAEIAIKMDEHVQKLDFTKATAAGSGSLLSVITRSTTTEMVKVQKACTRTVFDAIDMEYPKTPAPGGGSGDTSHGRCSDREMDIGRQAIRGNGMCVQQAVVLYGLLNPFAKMLGIDVMFKGGSIYRDLKPGVGNPFHDVTGHGWLQLSYRPSMTQVVCDRTWAQCDHPMDRAYGFPNGDRYPESNHSGFHPVDPTGTDVNMKISVETFDRQFATKGDGRENHI